MRPINKILYFAFGEYYVKQAVFSLISLLIVNRQRQREFEIVLFTDLPDQFEWLKTRLPLDVRILTHKEITELSGPHAFILRTKIAVIERIQSEFQGNILFIDTDTIMCQPLDGIFGRLKIGVYFLHQREWSLRDGRKLHPDFCPQDLEFCLESGGKININDETNMWNSGVVGIPETGRKLIHDALELCDKYYTIFPSWHVEQFCLSIILNSTGRLRGCGRQVYHYWHNKPLFEKATKGFFSLIAAGQYENALMEAEKIIPQMIFQMRVRYFFSEFRKFIRDFPGVYLTYRKFIKPFYKKILTA